MLLVWNWTWEKEKKKKKLEYHIATTYKIFNGPQIEKCMSLGFEKITILFFDENKKWALICKYRQKEKSLAHMCWDEMVKLNGAWKISNLQS